MKKAVFTLIAAAAVAAGSLNLTVAAGEESSYGLDYSRVGYSPVSVSAADFLEQVLGSEISASELEYLNGNSDFTLKYNDKVAGKYIKSDFQELSGDISVTPTPFSYTAVNGRTVTWEPVSVNGEQFSEVWRTTLSEDYEPDYVTVSYETSLAVSSRNVNGVLNEYYTAAKAASDNVHSKNAEYAAAYAEYQTNYLLYQQYLSDYAQYQNDLSAYNKYREELSAWNAKNNLYQVYLQELNQYESELKAYLNYEQAQKEYDEAYSSYQQYLTDKANYDKQYKEYLEIANDPRIATQKSHIEILDYIFTPVLITGDNARTIYGAIMGNTATYMLGAFGQLDDWLGTAGFPNKEPIEDAEKAGKILRDSFENLAKCKTDEDKYLFYSSSYNTLKENLTVFLQAMDYCYRTTFVHAGVVEQGRVEQVQVLLAQLYSICNALNNDTVVSYYTGNLYYERKDPSLKYNFDETYRIDGMTPAQILGGILLTDTDNAEPLAGGYITLPDEPVKPKEVTQPTPPEKVQKPIAPEEVENPGPAPETVLQPSEPREIKEPVEPLPYIPGEEEQRLADDYDGGNVVYRSLFTVDYNYIAECRVEHYFRNAQLLTVSFYLDKSADDDDWEWQEEDVQAGSAVEYGGAIPEMTLKGHTCRFAGWQDAKGNYVDINNVPSGNENLKLYPYFEITVNKYDVIWVVDGVEYAAQADYNTEPDYRQTFNGNPAKDADADGREYRFLDWDRKIEVMTDETVYYYAVFESSILITFKLYSDSVVESLWAGEVPEYKGETPERPADERFYYTFNGWNKNLVPAEKDTTYVAQFKSHYILSFDSGGAEIEKHDGVYEVDCTKTSQKTLDLSVLAEYAAGDGSGIVLHTSAITLTFTATETYLLHQSGAHIVTVNYSQIGSTSSGYGIYRFSVDFTGNRLETYTGSFTMTAVGKFDALHSRLYRLGTGGNADTSVETRYTYSENEITFSMRSGYVYEIKPQYAISVFASEDVAFTVNTETAAEKQRIIIDVGNPVTGKRVVRLYAVDSSGNEIQILADNTFVMPADDVKVGVVCEFIEYKVVFKVDGEIIATRYCHYGDEITAPNPVKPSDGEYSYTFIGWDKELSPVTKDIEYNARFSAAPLPQPDPVVLSAKIEFLLWVLENIVWILIVAAIVFVSFVTGMVLLIRHRKKRRINKK